MLFLHGWGESGEGNFDLIKVHGPPKIVEKRADFPFVVVSPQIPKPPYDMDKIIAAWDADQLIQLLDHVQSKLAIDQRRVYVSGLSMGGFGAWRLIAKYPDRFAAAVPVCGGTRIEWAKEIAKVPTWAFSWTKGSGLRRDAQQINCGCGSVRRRRRKTNDLS